jgi:hypothetical protein
MSEDGHPWYREPWPWILFGMPGVVVIASLVTFVIAYRGQDELVVDDYYKEGLGINRTLTRNRHALELGLTGQLHVDGGGVKLNLAGHDGVVLPRQIVLTFTHPTRAEFDQTVKLDLASDGYRGVMHPLMAGRWQIQVEDDARTWRLAAVTQLPAQGEIPVRAWLDSAP